MFGSYYNTAPCACPFCGKDETRENYRIKDENYTHYVCNNCGYTFKVCGTKGEAIKTP